jgi:hypothetical protein
MFLSYVIDMMTGAIVMKAIKKQLNLGEDNE